MFSLEKWKRKGVSVRLKKKRKKERKEKIIFHDWTFRSLNTTTSIVKKQSGKFISIVHAKLHTTTRRNSLRYYVRVIYSSRFNTRPYIVERYNSRRTGVCFASKRREVEARPRKAVYPTFPMKLDIEQVLSFSFSLYLPRSHFVPYPVH